VADYIVICGASSERQVRAIAEHVEKGLKDRGVRPIGTEGMDRGRWALLDYFDVVVHVFHAPVRDFYDIEGLWADAPRLNAGEALARGPGKAEGEEGGEATG
jgi:ribosome-associated protein